MMRGVSPHLFVHGEIDLVHHGARFAAKLRLGFELGRRRVDLVGIKILERRTFGRRIGTQDAVGSLLDLLIHLVHDHLQCLPVQNAFRDQPFGKPQQRIARFLGFALGLGLIERARRRKGNANRDALPWHAPAPDPCALAHMRRLR